MFEGATSEQARAVLAAAHQVVQQVPEPDDPRSGRGDAMVVAALDPIKFMVSWQRGDAMTTDVLDPGWDFFAVADRELEELRWDYGIPPLLPADSATGPEIVVAAETDPYAN